MIAGHLEQLIPSQLIGKSRLNYITTLLWFFLLALMLKFVSKVDTWPQGCNIIIGNLCYEVYVKRLYYSNAEEACKLRGGRLSRITSEAMSQNLSTYMQKALGCQTNDYNIHRFWIGLNDREEEGTFVWSNEEQFSKFNYSAWAVGEPDDKETTTFIDCDCVSMSAFSRKWFDESCFAYARGYICEYESRPCNINDLFIMNAEFDSCEANISMPYQTVMTMTCHPGYVITGSATVTCQPDGTWSEIPNCLSGCSPPPSIDHSHKFNDKQPYLVGNEVIYVCDEDYFTDDYPSRTHFKMTCSTHGTWISDHVGCSQFSPYDAKNIDLVTGDSITLPCLIDINRMKLTNTSSDKIPNVKTWMWLKDSENVENVFPDFVIQPNGSLLVIKFNEEAQGMYVCFLGNSFILPGKLSYELKLKTLPCQEVDAEKNQVLIEEGNSILLPCPHQGSQNSIQWFRDGIRLHDSSEHGLFPDGSLYVSNATFMLQGTYTCNVLEKHTMCSKNHTTLVLVLTSEKSVCGNVDKADDHPWTVSLWWEDEIAPFCYGTLIHDSWVLTSAQCLTGFYRRKKLTSFVSFDDAIRVGQVPALKDNGTTIAQIAAIVIHPSFDKKMYANDIGLVELENSVQFSENIQPLCLPDNDVAFISHCGKTMEIKGYVSGWGAIETAKSDSRMLKDESMRLLNEDMCNGTDASYWENIICTAHDNATEQSYAGDSGSPLEVEWKGRIYVVGIYSWGNRLKRKTGYDYFTRISTYRSWISSHVDADD